MKRSLLALTAVAAVGCSSQPNTSLATSTAEESSATKIMKCESADNAPVYSGNESKIFISADVSSVRSLKNFSLSMATYDVLGTSEDLIAANANYHPQNPAYFNHDKYVTADAWCGYNVIAPQNLNEIQGAFMIYLQESCEAGFVATATLSCRVDEVQHDAALEAQAQRYKDAIGDAQYMSEADYPWQPFYSTIAVGANFSIDEVKAALHAEGQNVEIWNNEYVEEFLLDYSTNNPYSEDEGQAYDRLKNALSQDFSDLIMIKVGRPDSGALDLYIVGRNADGKLVGVKTIAVET